MPRPRALGAYPGSASVVPFALYVAYHLVAPIVYAWHYFILGARFDLIQMVESNLTFGDISYTHFCHRMYMKRHWHTARIGGIRGLLRSFFSPGCRPCGALRV